MGLPGGESISRISSKFKENFSAISFRKDSYQKVYGYENKRLIRPNNTMAAPSQVTNNDLKNTSVAARIFKVVYLSQKANSECLPRPTEVINTSNESNDAQIGLV